MVAGEWREKRRHFTPWDAVLLPTLLLFLSFYPLKIDSEVGCVVAAIASRSPDVVVRSVERSRVSGSLQLAAACSLRFVCRLKREVSCCDV